MGKKNKHSKDKLHKTVGELRSHHTDDRQLELSALHRRLKFDYCCLSLNTLTDKPVGLSDDDDNYCYVFNRNHIVEFLEKFQVHPVTGKKVTAANLIELKFHKNDEDKYHCPVIYKLFNQHSKIVANKRSGHVYSYEAYQQLNLKPKNFKDLLTDEPFEKDDIVTIQDPEKADEKWNVTNFYYVKNKLKVDDAGSVSTIRNIDQSSILKSSLEEYKKQADSIVQKFNKIVGQDVVVDKPKLDSVNSASYSDGAVARSVTSTVEPVELKQRPALLQQDQILYPKIKKKGYVQMVTNMGPINLELFCDRTPVTCHNFLLLASRGYYDGTIFHRLIKNFILQGGDPTGTGSGGQSAWGQPFKDECHSDLKHAGRGVVAMANSGPGTNKSQFYITLRGTWDHLDGKHTVFGRVVGGDETLNRIESVEVDKKDRPKEEIKILSITKYSDPYEEVEKALEAERSVKLESTNTPSAKSVTIKERPLKKLRSGIGSYIDLECMRKNDTSTTQNSSVEVSADCANDQQSLSSQLASLGPARRLSKPEYGNFSSW